LTERRRLRAAALLLCAGLVAALLGGCRVATSVAVSEPEPGHGSVSVTVTLDSSALAALGGLAALRSQLSAGDLEAAGWSMTGPAPAPGGGAVVSATHGFGPDSEADQLISEIAGPGRFGLVLRSHRTFWYTYYGLSGAVDLRCGLECFGDTGLRAATGSPLGVDPGAVSAAAGSAGGSAGGSAFTFSVGARLPGRLEATDSPARQGGVLVWTPQLGRSLTVSARTRTVNQGTVVAVIGAAGVVLVALASWLSVRLVRRRRRRREAVREVVTPPS
jgi:hypothetical protein